MKTARYFPKYLANFIAQTFYARIQPWKEKKGHTKEEVDRILREAEERKNQAEAERSNEPKVTPADVAKKIEELGPDFIKEQKEDLNTD